MRIYWDQFTWEAFATLLTGLAVVLGATVVGLRQTRILSRQIRLSETNLRIELLDRRANCISKMREIVSEWTRDARLSPESWSKFQAAFFDAELLFSKQLVAEMDQALGSLFWKEHWERRARDYFDRGNEEKANQKLEDSFREDDKVFAVMPQLLLKMNGESRTVDWP